MRKPRTKSADWQDVPRVIMQLKKQLNITDDELRMLSPYENHQGIKEKIYQTFCDLEGEKRPVWLWHKFKHETYWFEYFEEDYLDKLINTTEKIWFSACSSASFYSHKMWLYEGNILAIQKLLDKTNHFMEMYFISKKYEWLICVNHAGTIIATGGDMPQRLELLHKQILQDKE